MTTQASGYEPVAKSTIRLIAREVAREMATEIALSELREVSGAEFARIVGMQPDAAVRLLDSGDVPMVRRTPGGERRVPIRGIRLWQEGREATKEAPVEAGAQVAR